MFKLEKGPESVDIRLAATIVLLRDGPTGPEVLMLERNVKSDFVGGAMVFPGGGVDAADAAGWDQTAQMPSSIAEHRLETFAMAALRECFEEAAIALTEPAVVAESGDGSADDSAVERDRCVVSAQHLLALRDDMNAGVTSWTDVCAHLGVTPTFAALVPFARWVTPLGSHRRYDTVFFATLAPEGAIAVEDGSEATNAIWITPNDAVQRSSEGEFTLIFPTAYTLLSLRSAANAQEAIVLLESSANLERETPTPRFGEGTIYLELSDGRVFNAETAEEVDPAVVKPSG